MKNIVRVEKNKDYTIINNTSLYDERLSWKAKAIHVFMLSKPDDWTFHNIELMKWAKDGRDAFASGLKELKDHGYVKKERRHGENGEFDWVTVVYEVPTLTDQEQVDETNNPPLPDLPCTEKPCMDKPSTGNPYTVKPFTENSQLLSTDIPSTELLSTNKLNTEFKNINNDDEKATPAPTKQPENAFTFYQANGFGVLSSYVNEKIGAWIDDAGEELVVHAMKLAIENNAIKWSYVETILRGWSQKQIKTVEQAEAEQLRFAAEKNKKQTQPYSRKRGGGYGPKRELVPEWFHKEQQPSAAIEVPNPINDENINFDAEYQKLLTQLRGGGSEGARK